MSYSGGLRYGYAELMRFNGIPLYPGVGPETGFRYRCKLRPHGRSEEHVFMPVLYRRAGQYWLAKNRQGGHSRCGTRAQAALAVNQ